jgi:hypothetical protein
MNKAIESNNAGEVFKTVEQEKLSKKQETKSVKLTYKTLPNFAKLRSFHGFLFIWDN